MAAAVGPDPAVAEVADQQGTGEPAEARRRDRHAPRRVQRAAARDAYRTAEWTAEAVEVEAVDEAEADAGHLVLLVRVLLGVGDVDAAATRRGHDVERREPGRQPRVGEQ